MTDSKRQIHNPFIFAHRETMDYTSVKIFQDLDKCLEGAQPSEGVHNKRATRISQ